MPDSISYVNAASQALVKQNIEKSSSQLTPLGISSNKSSIQSAQEQKSKGIFGKIKDSFFNVIKSIKNLFVSLFYHIFYCKAPPTEVELKYLDFKSRMERVDCLSDELVLKEANEFPIVFTLFGREVFKKSYNLIWKLWVCIPYVGYKTYYEMGKTEAEKDYKALIPHLKSYYQLEAQRLESKIRDNQS